MSELVQKQLVGGQPAVEKRLNWWVENFRFRVAQAVGRLQTGEDTLAEFQEFGREEIKGTLYGIAETGTGRRLTRKEIYRVRRVLKEQVKYWDRFAQAIADQRQTLKGLEGAELEAAEDKLYAKFGRRAQSYYGAIQAEGRQWYFDSRFPDGTWFRWDMDPLLENCETCIGRDKKVYQKKDGRLPFMPKDGTTICLYNCGCSWTQLVKPPSGRRKKLGPMGARRRGKKLRQKSGEDVFDWGSATTCGICGRLLTDPESVVRGVGPICWAEKGGKGSGHHGHAGRPGKVGGSLPSKGIPKGGFGDPDAIVSEEIIGSSNAQPTIVEFADGSRGIHKYNTNVTYGNPAGEVLTYEISEALGWGIVPETINWERELGPGTLQEFVEDSFTWADPMSGDKGPSQLPVESPAMTLLDAITGNRDRHSGNILETVYGELWAIDNNGAFGFMWGAQNYTGDAAADLTRNLVETLDWIREVGDPEQFVWAAQQYDGLFASITKFERSPKLREVTDKIREQIDLDTAYQFSNNIAALSKFGRSEKWQTAMEIWGERAEEEGFE